MALTSRNHSLAFWDTSAFVALLFARDKYHQQAKRIQSELQANNIPIFTTDAVLTELANGFTKPPARQVVIQFLNDVREDAAQGGAMLIRVDTQLWEQDWTLYSRRPDKSWGHTDCVSFVVMERFGIQRAFTSDRHFEQAGFIRLMAEED